MVTKATNMSTRITVEQIGLIRKGSDIDLEAIYQGHISGRRTHGVKSNPIYEDGLSINSANKVKIHTYNGSSNTNPSHAQNGDLEYKGSNRHNQRPAMQRENNIDLNESETSIIQKELTQNVENKPSEEINDAKEKESEMQRESLKVTNGDICVGDIIIENGFRNPAFVVENKELSENKTEKDVNLNYEIHNKEANDYNNKHKLNGDIFRESDLQVSTQNALILKEELNNLKENIHKGKLNEELKEDFTVKNDRSKGVQNSDWPDIDEIALPKENGHVTKISNGVITENGDVPNGYTVVSDSNSSEVSSDINQNHKSSKKPNQKPKSENKSSKKRQKERKNSLPDHILNSLSKKPSKPILIPSVQTSQNVSDSRKDSMVITEQKSVSFSNDTVFNENKPNKYRQERLNLRKLSNDGAVALTNPMFIDDDGFEISLTDDEKALRYFTQRDREGCQLGIDMNVPGYMKEYLLNGGVAPILVTKESLSRPHVNGIEDIESIANDTYENIARKEYAHDRRSRILRLTLACFAFAVVIGVVVLLVVYLGKPSNANVNTQGNTYGV